MTPVTELAGLRVAHHRRVVLDVPHLAVSPGEVLALIGPNGAGKSTLLRVMGLLQTPDAGTVRFQGESVTAAQLGRLVAPRAAFGGISVCPPKRRASPCDTASHRSHGHVLDLSDLGVGVPLYRVQE